MTGARVGLGLSWPAAVTSAVALALLAFVAPAKATIRYGASQISGNLESQQLFRLDARGARRSRRSTSSSSGTRSASGTSTTSSRADASSISSTSACSWAVKALWNVGSIGPVADVYLEAYDIPFEFQTTEVAVLPKPWSVNVRNPFRADLAIEAAPGVVLQPCFDRTGLTETKPRLARPAMRRISTTRHGPGSATRRVFGARRSAVASTTRTTRRT